MAKIFELTGTEYSFDKITWKPIIVGSDFGNRKQTVFIRPRKRNKIKIIVNGEEHSAFMLVIYPNNTIGILK